MPTKRVQKSGFISAILDRFGYIKASSVEQVISSMYVSQGAQGVTPTTSYSTLCDAYRGWVYTCIDKIAKTVATLPMNLYVYRNSTGSKVRGLEIKQHLKQLPTETDRRAYLKAQNVEKEVVEKHPFLSLIERPNAIDTRIILWWNTIMRMELAGSCGWYMPVNALGLPAEIWTLPLTKTASLRPIPDQQEVISGYLYVDGNHKQKFTKEELMWMRYPNPATPYEGKSPLSAQVYPYDIDRFLEIQQHSLLKNKANFGNVFTTDQQLKSAALDKLKASILANWAGVQKTGDPIFLHSGLRLDDKGLTQSAKDMMLEEVEEFARDKLITAYDLTPGKLGLVKDVNRSTAEVLNETFYQECVRPKTMLIEENIEAFILPRYDEDLTLDFELPEYHDKEMEIKKREVDIKAGVTTINEARAEDGREDVEWGHEPWMSLSMMQVGARGEPGAGPGTEPVKRVDMIERKLLTPAYWTKEVKETYWKAFAATTAGWEKRVIKTMQDYWDRQLKELLARLDKEGKAIVGQIAGWNKQKIRRLVTYKDNARVRGINIGKTEEAALLYDDLHPTMTIVVEQAGVQAIGRLGADIAYNVADPTVSKWLGSRIKEHSKEITGTTFDQVGAILREGFEDGWGTTKIATALRDKFNSYNKYRADAIARTEVIGASNYADIDAVSQAELDKVLKKFWINEFDARETHAAAGSIYNESGAIKMDAMFSVGGDSMTAPACGTLAKENINCRCTIGMVEA